MATAHHHHRTPSHPKAKSSAHPHQRPQRPAPLSKRASYQKNAKEAQAQKKQDDDDEVMAASFLNFCATCEKQIIVPSNSVLYCSESCRRKDTSKSFSHDLSPPQTPFSFSRFSFDDLPVARDIVTPRSPTTLPSHRLSYGFSEPSEDDSDSNHSEAARYLRSFPRANSTNSTNSTTDTTSAKPTHRPRYSRSSTSGINTSSNAPSLSHTPTSTASMSMPYTPSARTLRHPSTSYTANAHRDLVTPNPGPTNPSIAASTTAPSASSSFHHWSLKSAPSCQISTGIADGELDGFSYEKTPIASPGQGSLKQLFAFSAMQAPPTGWP
ncbi:hypothetical protein K490DRAFT_59892 [Saccharata proteae CBS 121410]|uniref:Life-span regulatory factor-domain-containing protein n=1 Tax=Saccharata proteae CBS 121410 TaxID=1314787 RepID=A0A9P4LUF2_9PEZI|nr:hypothetical protein K490DRAFT_59892 [Saccharata proteae CBS 121410]